MSTMKTYVHNMPEHAEKLVRCPLEYIPGRKSQL